MMVVSPAAPWLLCGKPEGVQLHLALRVRRMKEARHPTGLFHSDSGG